MFYYFVWVRSVQYHGQDALTYRHSSKLVAGTIVEVPLRDQRVTALIIGRAQRPRFATKDILAVYDTSPLPATTIKLGLWLQTFYPATLGLVTSQLIPKIIHKRYLEGMPKLNSSTISLGDLPPLTREQESALKIIKRPETYLLHGRTGSGKTRIYLELTARTLQNGRSVLVLSPEIGLTSQLATHFQAAFGPRVIILHSQLTAKERELAWLAALNAKVPVVVIGPRSALFSPICNLGLIIIDEAHDTAYKQEQAPYYQSLRVASELRILHQSILLLGSATPNVADYYMALERSKPIIRLTALAVDRQVHRDITVVDLKDIGQFSRSSHLSLPLIAAITLSLERHEQALVYLNRRGTARVALCPHCGWQALCPRCDLPLVYHGDDHQLRCHTCGYSQLAFASCPSCGNVDLAFRTFGTKAIVDEVRRLFPEARIKRFDTDNTKAERLENQYTAIAKGDVDIIVGTQMIAKGLDLPRLSTLGVALADASLYLPDFTAQERTYELLSQVIGRVGRGHVDSHVIVQTFNPTSALLKAALADDWSSFYNNEIAERKKYFFPPFSYLLKLTISRKSSSAAEHAAQKLKQALTAQHNVMVDGPAPAFREKVGGSFIWQLVVRSRNRAMLLKIIASLPNGWNYDIDPADLM